MRPSYALSVGGIDITGRIGGEVSELRLTDLDGFESDRLEIVLNNDGYQVLAPSRDTIIAVSLGYEETGLVFKGLFKVDEVEFEEPPSVMRIRAKSAYVKDDGKTQRNRSYDKKNQKLSDVLGQIAGRLGLGLQIAPSLANEGLQYWAQVNESDFHTISRLARRFDAIIKPANGQLVAVKRGEGLSASGLALGGVTITPEMCSTWRASFRERPNHKGVEAQYIDRQRPARVPVFVGGGQGTATMRLPQVFPNEQEARRAATSRQRELEREKGSFRATLVGTPELTQEVPITCVGFPYPVAGEWNTKRVEHVMLGREKYTTEVEAEVKPGRDTGGGGEKRSSSSGSSSGSSGGGAAAPSAQFESDFSSFRSQ